MTIFVLAIDFRKLTLYNYHFNLYMLISGAAERARQARRGHGFHTGPYFSIARISTLQLSSVPSPPAESVSRGSHYASMPALP